MDMYCSNGDFGNHEYGEQIFALTQRGLTKDAPPRPTLMNGGVNDEWPLLHTSMTVSSEFTGVHGQAAKYLKLPGFASKYPRDRFVAVIHSVYNLSYLPRVDALISYLLPELYMYVLS